MHPIDDLMDYESISSSLRTNGWYLWKNAYEPELMNKVIHEFEQKKHIFIDIQNNAGIYSETKNATHHTLLHCPSLLKLLEDSPLNEYSQFFFSGNYILNTMGISCIPPSDPVYTQNIHRDTRSFNGAESLWLNSLIMLSDSTLHNGATWILEGSQYMPNKPSDDYFYGNARRVEGECGDVLLFHGHVWHAAGTNLSSRSRYVVTPFYSKPFIKPQLDYYRAFKNDPYVNSSEILKQLLGFYSRIPVSLEDFYQPMDKRFYQSNQG